MRFIDSDKKNIVGRNGSRHEMRHNHHSFRRLTYPKDLLVYLIQDKKRSCMVDIDTPRPICARWLVPRKKPSLPCRWPQLWHIGIRRVLLWVTLLCAGMGKRCSCGEPLPCALSESPALSDSLSHSLSLTNAQTHTHICASKQTHGPQGCISSSVKSEKNKLPSESNIWLGSNGVISWALTDTVPQKTHWLERSAPLFELWAQLFAQYMRGDFFLHCFHWGWCVFCLCQLWFPRTIGR